MGKSVMISWLNRLTDFDKIWYRDGLDLGDLGYLLGYLKRCSNNELEIYNRDWNILFVYKLLLLMQVIIVIGEITISFLYISHWLIWQIRCKYAIKSNFHTLPIWYAVVHFTRSDFVELITREAEFHSKRVEQSQLFKL